MDYGAVVSLKHTIERLLNSSQISFGSRSLECLGFAKKGVEFLQNFIKISNSSSSRSRRKRASALNAEIREAVSELEIVLEPYASNQINVNSQSESPGDEFNPFLFSTDIRDLEKEIFSFSETVMKLKEERSYFFEEDDEDEVSYAESLSRISHREMIGLSDEFRQTKNRLTRFCPFPFPVFSIVGMAGIGKTNFARKVYQDPDILEYFQCRVWVRVGRKCHLEEMRRAILAEVNPNLKEGRRCLVVLDDVWDTQVLHDLKGLFPNDDDNGSRILLTTRLHHVALDASKFTYGVLEMQLLTIEKSWTLLCSEVFAEEWCPSDLQEAGKKIAENCEGLPLTIVVVASLLSQAEKTLEYWSRVGEQLNSLFTDAYDHVSEVLYPSYDYLTPQLKVCFLYMGLFPQSYEIPKSKLINMWTAEGVFESQTSENSAAQYLNDFILNNLVIVCQKSTTAEEIKTCRLHSSLWHLCKKESQKNKFFHAYHKFCDVLPEGQKRQRRLCINSNLLPYSEDLYNSLEASCASTARFLQYYGPYHQYPLPICCGLSRLKILDALTIRFYEFPIEVLDLVYLRYLAITYDGSIPTSISELSNLQFLIVHQHLSINDDKAPSYLPLEIWDMNELKHIQVVGSNLPDCLGALLLNLQTLLDVSSQSCAKGVLSRIPNLKKLGIRIELVPDNPLSCFDDISNLYKLESLKCVVVNTELRSEVAASPPVLSKFPTGLTKLTLSGFGYPWEYMKAIASLPKLEVLKLRCYAFRGPKWEIEENGFKELKFLLIEDTDLVQCKLSFPNLACLSIERCYKLERLRWVAFDGIVPDIKIVECNPVDFCVHSSCGKLLKSWLQLAPKGTKNLV